jgi:hypothetical protein
MDRQDLNDSVKANPFDIGVHHKLSQAYLQSGDPAAAQPHTEASRKLTDGTYGISEVEELLNDDPSNIKLQRELASLRGHSGQVSTVSANVKAGHPAAITIR